jgi:fatty acid-binding protein DegV
MAGLDLDALTKWVEENKLAFAHWFTVDDLVYLKRGGRVSGATAAIATILNIKPVMHTDNEGYLTAVGKVQGRKKSPGNLFEHSARHRKRRGDGHACSLAIATALATRNMSRRRGTSAIRNGSHIDHIGHEHRRASVPAPWRCSRCQRAIRDFY